MEIVGREASFLLLLFFAGFIPFIFFLITQQNTLKAIQQGNRVMSPGEVWLQLIPVFNVVWMFVVVVRISKSISKELKSETGFSFEKNKTANPVEDKRPTLSIGLTYCILLCISLTPIIGGITSLAGLICWIVYWIQLSDYKSRIQSKVSFISR